MDAIVFKNGYIDTRDFENIKETNKNIIIKEWIYSKNKHTQKEFYIKPPPAQMNDNVYQNVRFELLKNACEHQPETYEEQLLRELNIK